MSNFVKIPVIILIVIAILAILFLVVIPAALKHRIQLAPAKVVPAVTDIASSTAFFETGTLYVNSVYEYQFYYPADHTPYSSITSGGALVKANATSKSVSIARDETRAASDTTEVFRIRAFPEMKKATAWIDAYYPDKSQITANKTIFFGGYPARDVLGKGSTSSPARIMVVETPKGIVAIEQNVKSNYLNSIFATVEFKGAVAWVPIKKRETVTPVVLPEPIAWVRLSSSTNNTSRYNTKTGQFKTGEYPEAGAVFLVPTDFPVKRVSVINGIAYELANGNMLTISPPDVPLTGTPPLLIFSLDRRAVSIEEWYLRYYNAKSSVVKTIDFSVDGYRSLDIMGASTLASPYRTRVVDRGDTLFVAIEVIHTPLFDYILSTLRFYDLPTTNATTNSTISAPSTSGGGADGSSGGATHR